ncbi:hypothetical protein ACIQXA_07865 [Streptomyces massasporeus]|uniref:hypothetical protein n=1 Tax=Streptomyces massasporeus TaxID=67324 RepID=UPI00381DCF47
MSARTFRARADAVAAGREPGLDVGDARVVHDVCSVVVHLAPPPAVVRVPAVLPSYADAESRAARQRRELDVVGWLADQGHPVIPPGPLVPREPVARDGFSMTFWQFAGLDQGAEPDHVRRAGLVADVHAALRSYPGVLPFLSAAEPRFVTEGLAALEGRPDLLEPISTGRGASGRCWSRSSAHAQGSRPCSPASGSSRFTGTPRRPTSSPAPTACCTPTSN